MSYTEDAVSGAGAHAIDGSSRPRPPTIRSRCTRRCTPSVRSRGRRACSASGVSVTRYEDVLWAFKHPEVFSSKDVVKIGNDVPLIPLSVDPPDHAKYRRLLDPQFSPKQMAELEPEMRKLVNEIIDEFIDRGECDFHEDFATPLPSTIFLALDGPAAGGPAALPEVARRHDPPGRRLDGGGAGEPRGDGSRHQGVLRERDRGTARRTRRRPPAQHDRARRGRGPAADARRAARHDPPAPARWARHRHRDARLHDRLPRETSRTAAGARRRSRARSGRGRGAAAPPDAGDDGAAQDRSRTSRSAA